MQCIMFQRKVVLAVAGLFTVIAGFALGHSAEASSLQCRNGQLAVGRGNVYFQAADQAAGLHAYFGDLSIKKTGPIRKARLLQQCTNASRSFEGVALNFEVVAKGPRTQARTYLCLAKQKRYIDHTGGWSRWFNVETLCRVDHAPAHRGRVDEGRGYGDTGSAGPTDNGAPIGPDEMYDPDFARREADYGPDAVNDGSAPRTGGEFGDLPF